LLIGHRICGEPPLEAADIQGARTIDLQTEPRRDAREALDAAAALPLIQALASLHESVLLIDPEGRVFWMSERLAELCGGAAGFGARASPRCSPTAAEAAR
jgi:PAS domain-containing protein